VYSACLTHKCCEITGVSTAGILADAEVHPEGLVGAKAWLGSRVYSTLWGYGYKIYLITMVGRGMGSTGEEFV